MTDTSEILSPSKPFLPRCELVFLRYFDCSKIKLANIVILTVLWKDKQQDMDVLASRALRRASASCRGLRAAVVCGKGLCWAQTETRCFFSGVALAALLHRGYGCSSPPDGRSLIAIAASRLVDRNKMFRKRFMCSGQH